MAKAMWLFGYVVLELLVFYVRGQLDVDDKVIFTIYGEIRGFVSATRDYYEFCGIRYATLKSRYEAPQEPMVFVGIYNADVRSILCPQFPFNDPLADASEEEDCLFLNVYLPKETSVTLLPVMVFLHGGDFGIGGSSPHFYSPKFLVNLEVIVVTVNFRLNAFGFLNLGIREAPGNAGLKDIRAALRWVKENIEYFNGDKENVTVFGHGSGGIAAFYLTMSKSCEGLFHRIISESGTMFSPKSFDPYPIATASQVAQTLGMLANDVEELIAMYSQISTAHLEEAIGVQMYSKSVFLPSVETYLDGDPFLTDTPYNIIARNDCNPVPAIIGLNTVEGLTSLLGSYTISSQLNSIKNGDFSCLNINNFWLNEEEEYDIRSIIKDTYFSDTTDEEQVLGGLVNFYTDFYYVGPMSLFSEVYFNSSTVDVYQYIFNYIGNRNLGRILTKSSLAVTTNLDELFYVFDLERLYLPMDEADARIVNFMTIMWTEFAKNGELKNKEIGEWHPYPNTLAISLEPTYVAPLTPDRAAFWRTMYLNFGVEIESRRLEI